MNKREELKKIVGGNRVLEYPENIAENSRSEDFYSSIQPEYIVKPENENEVRQIIKWANETLTPLVPVSSGAPHLRDGSVPGTDGAVLVDLSGMKRIIRVDRRNRVAMVEPGVTFGELQEELKKNGLRLNMPMLPLCQKSVMGSVLEREPVMMSKYHWDMVDPLACTGVVFGSGDVYRTGAAAGPGTVEEQWKSGGAQKSPADPLVDWVRLVQGAQGTMGIVTWATVRCELIPSLKEPFMVPSSSLDGLLELSHWLIRLRLADECLILNNVNLARILAGRWPEDYERLRDALPPLVLFFCIGGYEYLPEEKMAYQIEQMTDIAKRAEVEPVKALNGITASGLWDIFQRPSEDPYWKMKGKGSCHDIFCLATYDRLPELIKAMNEATGEFGYPVSDMGIYLQPVVQGTGYHCEFNLFVNPADPEEANSIKKLSTHAVQSLMNKGAFFSRPYGAWVNMVYGRDTETAAALRKIKGIVDPNNIMNPGKLCFPK
ncbi:MAG: FAD-binding oxidoreductase [Dehalococcoidales bacterium]|nr:FAD-binding oxidoreductase [Dehalococcoidales bacterium]